VVGVQGFNGAAIHDDSARRAEKRVLRSSPGVYDVGRKQNGRAVNGGDLGSDGADYWYGWVAGGSAQAPRMSVVGVVGGVVASDTETDVHVFRTEVLMSRMVRSTIGFQVSAVDREFVESRARAVDLDVSQYLRYVVAFEALLRGGDAVRGLLDQDGWWRVSDRLRKAGVL
jgi:hypothetical protein